LSWFEHKKGRTSRCSNHDKCKIPGVFPQSRRGYGCIVNFFTSRHAHLCDTHLTTWFERCKVKHYFENTKISEDFFRLHLKAICQEGPFRCV
jgi:hypothetical protein